MRVEDIAKVCHEANRALTDIIGKAAGNVPPQPSWEMAPTDMREGCMKGVTFAMLNPNASPEDLHTEWCRDKLANGWRFGEERSEMLKTHPALRPYADLPLAQRKKDALFRAIVKALAPDEAIMKEAIEAAAAEEQGADDPDEEDDSDSAAFQNE